MSDNLINDDFFLNLKQFIQSLQNIINWTNKDLQDCTTNFININNINFPSFGKPLRLILINSKNGPSINDILYILGKEKAFLRLNKYINNTL